MTMMRITATNVEAMGGGRPGGGPRFGGVFGMGGGSGACCRVGGGGGGGALRCDDTPF